ncbi:MAG TPA: HoxN/HupN/NixA family nickel/cobalt transporter [Streptosporangiaceae bacterium]
MKEKTPLMAQIAARARRASSALTPSEWGRAGGMAATVLGLNVLGWGLLLAALRGHYHITKTEIFGVGTGILAYTLGMRHAFDADHIAAIDNTTRKLVADGKRPLSVGFFFSLGHSSVVFVLALLLNFGIRALNAQVRNGGSALHSVTGTVGVLVSGTFLYLIAGLNLIILVSIVKVFRDMRLGRYDDAELEEQLARRGLMNRFLGPLARRVDTPWKMYPIGLLFGLGFDTATEIALLVLAGSAVVSGLPFYAVLSLPLLFAAGMSLFDTADGCFMNFAYDWAFARPLRKVYYNLTITGLSVFVAFFVGTIEVLGLIAQQSHLTGGWWGPLRNFNLNMAGFVIVGMFALTWVVALAIWHFGRIEERWDTAASSAD